jgi:PilZ domain
MQMKERGSERIEFLCAGEESENTLIDLSVTGVAFVHSSEAKKDSVISVRIKTFSLKAVVVYCQPRAQGFRIGLQFKNVPADVQRSLGNLVEEFSRGVPLTCEIIDPDRDKKVEADGDNRE